MSDRKIEIKALAAQACIHTAACLIEEVLEAKGIVFKNLKTPPSKLLKDLLSARSKMNDCCDRIMPDFNAQQTDFINQVSYIIEDVITEVYDKNYSIKQ
jgi:hypothetical protein